MELAPDLADAHLARGYTLSNQRRYEEAQPAFRSRGAHQSRTCSTPTTTTAAPRSPRGDIEKSIELWRKAGEVRREDFESPLLQAQSMRKLGQIEESRIVNREAVRRAEKLLELNPSNGRVLSFGAGALAGRRPERARAGMGAARRGALSG